MDQLLLLPKNSLGVGDRFAHQAKAQLRACVLAGDAGVEITPVWNKSNREHLIIGSEPAEARAAADAAVRALDWTRPYFCDADHINLSTVGRFLEPCDFFTIDVADLIGKAADPATITSFAQKHPELSGDIGIPGVERSFSVDRSFVDRVAAKFLAAVQQAGEVYRHIAGSKGAAKFITEISVDETDSPQTPVELLIILAAIADEEIPIQTIAPKFTGRFNKGVDYAGDLAKFSEEFSDDLAVLRFAVSQYGLPANLKLSVHSGSDKFSIYQPIREALRKHDAGIHVKTAGTTWLEELIGLAEYGALENGGSGLDLAKTIYREAFDHREELCAPYSSVIDIQTSQLPTPNDVASWSSAQFASALRHEPVNPAYNSSMRQLLHVGFKVAAKMGNAYLNLLDEARSVVSHNVTTNLFERHIRPLFLDS